MKKIRVSRISLKDYNELLAAGYVVELVVSTPPRPKPKSGKRKMSHGMEINAHKINYIDLFDKLILE